MGHFPWRDIGKDCTRPAMYVKWTPNVSCTSFEYPSLQLINYITSKKWPATKRRFTRHFQVFLKTAMFYTPQYLQQKYLNVQKKK